MALEEQITTDQVKDGVDAETVEAVRSVGDKYKYGFSTDIEMEYAPMGLNEDIVRHISEKNNEPEWMTDWRVAAYKRWLEMTEPEWAMVDYPKIDFQSQYYYAQPASMAKEKPKSLDDVDPELLRNLRKARHSVERAGHSGGRRRRRRLRSVPAQSRRRRRVRQRSRWAPPSKKNSPLLASSSARSRKPSKSILSW